VGTSRQSVRPQGRRTSACIVEVSMSIWELVVCC
jgi:hypothetical protein